MDPLALGTPRCLQEGWKTRMLNPYRLPKKTQQKRQVPNDEKNLHIESKLIQVIQWKDKRKRKEINMIWNNHFKLLTFYWTSSPRCLRTSQCPCAGSPQNGIGPCPWQSSNPEGPQQDTAEHRALSVSAPRHQVPWTSWDPVDVSSGTRPLHPARYEASPPPQPFFIHLTDSGFP